MKILSIIILASLFTLFPAQSTSQHHPKPSPDSTDIRLITSALEEDYTLLAQSRHTHVYILDSLLDHRWLSVLAGKPFTLVKPEEVEKYMIPLEPLLLLEYGGLVTKANKKLVTFKRIICHRSPRSHKIVLQTTFKNTHIFEFKGCVWQSKGGFFENSTPVDLE